MTTETDKMVEMARERGAFYSAAARGWLTFRPDMLAAFRAAIIADLCGDAEPFVFEEYPYNSEAMGCGLEDRDITDRYEAMAYGWSAAMERAAEAIPDDLYPASTVAALTAQRDAALARVAELEKDAARYRWLRRGQKWSVVDGIGTVLRADELDAAIDAALTKGQLAPQPQQEQSK